MWKCPKCGRQFKNTDQSHFCGEKPKSIDEYIQGQDVDKRDDLYLMDQTLRLALPEAEKRISWSMPTYWKRHNIIHFAASKKHIGLYPGPDAVETFAEENAVKIMEITDNMYINESIPRIPSFNAFEAEINHFVDCIINGTKCIAPIDDGVALMEIIDALYKSAQTGAAINL